MRHFATGAAYALAALAAGLLLGWALSAGMYVFAAAAWVTYAGVTYAMICGKGK